MELVAPGIRVVAVRTPTLPPATHTNTWVLGDGELVVVDPASPWDDEQARLAASLEARLAEGERVARIFLTHHHPDHVGGALALRDHLASLGQHAPIAAHPATAERVARWLPVDELVADGEVRVVGGRTLRALHTPGHAPGHLVLHDAASGAVVAGDMVAGIGTILVEPDDGDLGQYLASLELVRALGPSVLLPAHGPALHQADAVLSFYASHRNARTESIRRALDGLGRATAFQVAEAVYGREIPREVLPIAARQVVSHLRWLASHGLAQPTGRLEGGAGIVAEVWER